MAAGALIGGIGSLIGGAIGSNAASTAGGILGNAGNTAATNITGAGQTAIGGLTAPTQSAQQGVTPYTQAGAQGISTLAAALGPNGSATKALSTPFSFNPSDLQNTPGYQFQLQQGLQANKNAMTAGGLGGSGAAVKGANNYATGLAGTYFQNAYANANNTYQVNRQNTLYQLSALQNLAGTGLQSSEYSGNVGLQSATQAGNWGIGSQEAAMQAYMTGQQGVAAGVIGSANAWNQALGGVANSANSLSSLNSMYGGGGVFGGGSGSMGGGWGNDIAPVMPGSGSYSSSTGMGGNPWSTYSGAF
jgi:hypothetical protein